MKNNQDRLDHERQTENIYLSESKVERVETQAFDGILPTEPDVSGGSVSTQASSLEIRTIEELQDESNRQLAVNRRRVIERAREAQAALEELIQKTSQGELDEVTYTEMIESVSSIDMPFVLATEYQTMATEKQPTEYIDLTQHPMQPLVFHPDCPTGESLVRFKQNHIVRFLYSEYQRRTDVIPLKSMPFDQLDWDQLFQLIGYSVTGYSDLDSSRESVVRKVERRAEQMLTELNPWNNQDA